MRLWQFGIRTGQPGTPARAELAEHVTGCSVCLERCSAQIPGGTINGRAGDYIVPNEGLCAAGAALFDLVVVGENLRP